MTSGRPSVKPLSDPVGVIGARGGIEAQFGCESKPDEFMCDVCAVDDEDELRAADEEDQAETVNPLPTQFQTSLSQYPSHYTPTIRTSRGALIVSKDAVMSLGSTPTRRSRE